MQIHAAAKRGDIEGLKYCLGRGVPVDLRDSKNNTPLIAALDSLRVFARRKGLKGGLETVRFLLDAGADPNAAGWVGSTPLHAAAASGQLDLVHYLCERGADPGRHTDSAFTTLISACYQPPSPGKLEIIRWLVAAGVSLDDASKHNESPLSTCLYFGDFAALRLLLDLGASPAPLHWNELHRLVALGSVAELRAREISAAALNQPSPRWELTPLLLAVKIGDLSKVSHLAKLGAPLDQPGRLGSTALHLAAGHDRAEVAACLLEYGAMIEDADNFGKTPLMTACQHDAARVVNVLLGAGAAVEANGKQAINQACSSEVIQLLVERSGAEVNSIDDYGEWPLKTMASLNDTKGIAWLLAHGAQVDLTSTGETALHAAIRADAREAAQLLLQHGANPNAQDVDCCTPLTKVQSREALQLLLNHGADPKIPDQIGRMPVALMKDHLLAELL